MWKIYYQLHHRFLSDDYNDEYHFETLKIIEKFFFAARIMEFPTPMFKIHTLLELWYDCYKNSPCWIFETSPFESKHKEY